MNVQNRGVLVKETGGYWVDICERSWLMIYILA